MSLLNLIKVARFIFNFLKIQNRFNDKFIDSYLQPFNKKYNRELKESTLLKIRKYYCLGIPLAVATYTKLFGRKPSKNEREFAILMGIFVPLVDDFTDDNTLNSEAIDQLISSPADYEPKTPEEAVVKYINCFFWKM
jgi:hypothetical protein